MRTAASSVAAGVAALALGIVLPAGAQTTERLDYLTFAQGAIPVAVRGAGADQGAGFEHAVRLVDGNPGGFTVVNRANADTDVEFIYSLPSPTTFDRFAVPDVLETPSPSQTFFRQVEVYGSDAGPDGEWTLLASATLETHAARGLTSEIPVTASPPVRWVRVRLIGGIEMLRDDMFLEFSEIVGNGSQEAPPLATAFSGSWRGRGVRLDLTQDGATVAGCYDTDGDLTGTVTGNLLRAVGTNRTSGVGSAFLLSVTPEGALRGLRSTNGAPFAMYEGLGVDGPAAQCEEPVPPVLGCGSVVHGITFDFDSAVIRDESGPVLQQLFEGLRADASASIVIEGHTSSEGDEAYNQDLSRRRAQAVVDDLAGRGIDRGRLSAAGLGESRPVASNDDETGRSLNRRVEISCS